MNKQRFSRQVCGLAIGVAGVLAPVGLVQAADELADRYTNGYLNDPYTNEKAPERASVFASDVKSIQTSDASGAQGPIRDDSMMKKESFRQDQPVELYTGHPADQSGKVRGAEGPVRESPSALDDKPKDQRQIDREWFERYSGS